MDGTKDVLGGEEGSAEIDGTKLGCRKKGERKVENCEMRSCTARKNIVKVKQLTEVLGEEEGSAEVDGLRDGSSSHGHFEVTLNVTSRIVPSSAAVLSTTLKVQSPRGEPSAKLESLLFPTPSP